MAIRFSCGTCGKRYAVVDAHAGKRTTCNACGASLQVPEAGADEEADLSPLAPLQTRPPAPAPRLRASPHAAARSFPAPTVEQASSAPRFLLSDGAARSISGALLLVLILGGAYLVYRLITHMSETQGVPEELHSRLYTYAAMMGGWFLLVFFVVTVPLILLASSLAANWTKWELPDAAFLRAAGTATLPYLLIAGIILAAVNRDVGIAIAVILAMPLVLMVALRELMALKWSTTAIAAGLLMVLMTVAGLIMRPIHGVVQGGIAKLAKVDEASLRQWAQENPEAMRDAREARAAGGGGGSVTARQEPDPLAGNAQIAELTQELRDALKQAPTQTREQIAAARPPLAERVKAMKPADGKRSTLWLVASDLLAQIDAAAASAPGEAPPANLFQPIPDRPLPIPTVDAATTAEQTFAFRHVRFRPPKRAKIDLKAFESPSSSQRWILGPWAVVELTSDPAADAKQQRPWVGDRPIVAQLAKQKNLFAVIVKGKPEISEGRHGGIAWTRIAARDAHGRLVGITYTARVGDGWLVAKLAGSVIRDEDEKAIGDFVQGMRMGQPGEPALDPYDPAVVVVRFADAFDDPSPVIRAAGPRGVEALRAYATRMGEKAPSRATQLLDEMTAPTGVVAGRGTTGAARDPSAPAAGRGGAGRIPAIAGPVDVEAELALIRGDGSSFAKRDALKRLAAAKPDEKQRDAVAAACELLIAGDDASFYGAEAADALAVWWRPATVPILLPLLEEKVWPPSKRTNAIKVLSKTGDKRVVFPIVRWIIKEPDEVVPALIAMGPVAEDEVVKLLREKDPAVRSNAARILEPIGTQKCLIELRRAANDPRDGGAAAVARVALEAVLARVKQAKVTAPTAPTSAPSAVAPPRTLAPTRPPMSATPQVR